jgi:photosystem II stability/assembly factor-like uncharacterized protein
VQDRRSWIARRVGRRLLPPYNRPPRGDRGMVGQVRANSDHRRLDRRPPGNENRARLNATPGMSTSGLQKIQALAAQDGERCVSSEPAPTMHGHPGELGWGSVEWTSVRAQRAAKLIGVAIVVVVVAAVVYLGPGWARARSQGSVLQPSSAPSAGRVSVASFGDADNGAVLMVGEFGTNRSYITSNGGRSWTQQGQGYIQTTFFDRNHAIAIENGIGGFWTTADAGRTWAFQGLPANAQRSGFTTNVVGSMSFLDPMHGWWFDVEPDSPTPTAALLRTSDGGRTWDHLGATGVPADRIPGSPVFIDTLRGAVVAWPPGIPGWPSILTTQDGGNTWESVAIPKPPVSGAYLAEQGPAGTTLVAHGGRIVLSLDLLPARTLIPSPGAPGNALPQAVSGWSSVSDDGGLSWTSWSGKPATAIASLVFCSPIDASGSQRSCPGLGAPVFDDEGRLLLVDDQRLWSSHDAGHTWQSHPTHVPRGVHLVTLVSAHGGALFATAWEGGRKPLTPSAVDSLGLPAGMLFRSRDGGVQWSVVQLPRG